ncbi:MAG: tetratricopeptide repeat protein [Candidatus Poribacteria bacterium]|nr:tetratricopeptide repeat protein [Candidatus Poribacteria bacterium]
MSSSREAVELYNHGLSLAKQNRYREAIQLLAEATEVDADYVNAYNVLGKAYMQEGSVREAREAWMEVLRRDPFNTTAMKCLDASYPKPFWERFQSIILVATLVGMFGLLGAILFSVNRLAGQFDMRLRSLEEKSNALSLDTSRRSPFRNAPAPTTTEKGSTEGLGEAAPPENANAVPTGDSNGLTPPSGPIDVPLTFIESTANNSHATSQKDSDGAGSASTDAAKRSQPVISQPSPRPTPSILTTISEADAQFKNGMALYERGTYPEALEKFQAIAQSGLSHRYLIGGAHYWAGVCYVKLGQPQKALAAFQKVTDANSYKYQDAQKEIEKIQ